MTQENHKTKTRLLEVAAKLFAEKGYAGTTLAEISRLASANIAAVNYHFGNKEELYREAWRHAHRTAIARFPADGGVSPSASADERLRGRLGALLQRVLHDDGLEFRIMDHEMANPTGLLGQVVSETLQPLGEEMERIVRELLGVSADENSVKLCATSVIAPCLHVMRKRRMQQMAGDASCPEGLDQLVEHFARFALGGIDSVAQTLAASKGSQ